MLEEVVAGDKCSTFQNIRHHKTGASVALEIKFKRSDRDQVEMSSNDFKWVHLDFVKGSRTQTYFVEVS